MTKLLRLTESDFHKIIKESVKKIINENDNAQISILIDEEEYRDLCEKLYPFKKYLSEISQFGKITNKGMYYNFYDETINSFIFEYKATDFYDKYGNFDKNKLKKYLNSYFESDIYSED